MEAVCVYVYRTPSDLQPPSRLLVTKGATNPFVGHEGGRKKTDGAVRKWLRILLFASPAFLVDASWDKRKI